MPNDWQKRVRAVSRSGAVSERSERYGAFWGLYLDRMAAEQPTWGQRTTPQPSNWMGFSGPFRGAQIVPSFATGRRLRQELYIDTGDAEANAALFDSLLQHRPAIEAAYGRPLALLR